MEIITRNSPITSSSDSRTFALSIFLEILRVETKSYRVKSEKKPKTETPIVIRVRSSLRTRGIPPDCGGLDGDSVCPTTPSEEKPPWDVSLGPLSMANSRESAHYDSSFIESPMGMAQDDSVQKEKVVDSLELESLSLDPENIAIWEDYQCHVFPFQWCQNACREEQVMMLVKYAQLPVRKIHSLGWENDCRTEICMTVGLTLDFNCENPHIVATNPSDATACTWDLRYINNNNLTALKTFTHKNLSNLLISLLLEVALQLQDWRMTFYIQVWFLGKAKWGWDDKYLFIGNMNRGVDVVSAVQRKRAMTLESPHMCAIPCRFAINSSEVGILVGGTVGGQVYVWTSC
ncbi:hypothetical protein VNO80_22265 [Phaseolus coccineus]|uniref:Uncharacterized protein n=1 Tax=Phaseolus coccineus TaxID=3886 RepID=A0AAN9M5C7_PHACN